MGQILLCLLSRFGSEPTAQLVALVRWWTCQRGYFGSRSDKAENLLSFAWDVTEGPEWAPAWVVARLKGLITP